LRPFASSRLALGFSTPGGCLIDAALDVGEMPPHDPAVQRPNGERADDDADDQHTDYLRHRARVYG